MRCFNHPKSEAIGICKVCNKGLCEECVTDLGHGLACKGVHEEDALLYNTIAEASSRVVTPSPIMGFWFPLVFVFLGVVMIWKGLNTEEGMTSLSFLYGLGVIAFAVVVYLRNKKVWSSINENT